MIWGQLAESDQVWSDRTSKWYEITTVSTTETHVRVWVKGVPKPFIQPLSKTIPDQHVRRGEAGRVMDLFITVFSGQTTPEPPTLTDEVTE